MAESEGVVDAASDRLQRHCEGAGVEVDVTNKVSIGYLPRARRFPAPGRLEGLEVASITPVTVRLNLMTLEHTVKPQHAE